jgi:hypothetical protein
LQVTRATGFVIKLMIKLSHERHVRVSTIVKIDLQTWIQTRAFN